jgi:hypothetical protein
MRLTCGLATRRFAAAPAEEQCFFVRAVNGYVAHFEPGCVAGKRQSVQHLPSHPVWLCSVGMDESAAVERCLEWGGVSYKVDEAVNIR